MLTRSFRVLCLWLLPGLALPVAGWQFDSELRIDRILLPETNAEVKFEPQPGVEDPDGASKIRLDLQAVRRSTKDEKYVLYFLPSKVSSQNGGSYFSYVFFVVARAQPQSYIRYQLTATSKGSFLATRKETKFQIGSSEGQIDLPVYCPNQPGLIEVVQASSLTKVAIAGDSIRVSIKNLSGLGLLVRVSKADGPGLTGRPPDPKRKYAINPSGTKELRLDVKPSVFRALSATYAPASVASPHGYLNLGLECEFSDTSSIELEPVTAALPLEFSPSFWHLGLAVAMGAIVAWVFCVLVSMITGYRRTTGIVKLLARLAVSVLLGWILDAGSAVSNSRLILFDLDVNPTRLPPAFMLGLISGAVGTWYLDRLIDWLEKKVRPQAGPAPAPIK